jgi:hypothetical protein
MKANNHGILSLAVLTRINIYFLGPDEIVSQALTSHFENGEDASSLAYS